MKALHRILYLLLLAGLPFVGMSAQTDTPYFQHTIEQGQSLYSIATMYGVSQEDILRLNPGLGDILYAGESIRIPQQQRSTGGERFHTIQPGETLYRLTVLYGVSAEAICQANPGLSAGNFRSGQVIRIPHSTTPVRPDSPAPSSTPSVPDIQEPVTPRCREMHKVKRRETLFSISRQYHISEEELTAANPEVRSGLKKGQWLCIPYSRPESRPSVRKPVSTGPATVPSNQELFNTCQPSGRQLPVVRAAILLPFTQDKRMTEYYEGLLLAADSLKRSGVSLDLQVYNCDNQPHTLDRILSRPELQDVHILFGPTQPDQLSKAARFAASRNIRLVVPFSSKEDEVFRNPCVYQVNTPQSYLYSEVYEHFFRQFRHPNVVFLQSAGHHDKDDFIQGLRNELHRRNLSFHTLPDTVSVRALESVTDTTRTNLYIPTTGSNISLIRLIPQLTLLVRQHPSADIHLFGYPEWQTYTVDHLDSFFELDTYFYSSFYTNNLLPAAKNFNRQYRKWYGKEMSLSYPKYGMLGFDTGYFFLKGLSLYGTSLETNLDRLSLTPIQTGFKFERVNNWGGFINRKVFFVRFSKNYELIKLDFE